MFTKNIVSSCLTLEEIRLIKHSRITELWAFAFISLALIPSNLRLQEPGLAIEQIFGACDTVLNLRDEGKEMHNATTYQLT